MSPQLDHEVQEPQRRRRRKSETAIADPRCEHCGAEAHFIATATQWIHRRGDDACGFIIKEPTEGTTIVDKPERPKVKPSIYIVGATAQAVSPVKDRGRIRRGPQSSNKQKPAKVSRRWR